MSSSSAPVLVVGAGGQLGAEVTRQLLEHRWRLRALARSPSASARLRELGVDIAFGNLNDRSGLDEACEGVAVVVCTATAIARRLTGERGASISRVDDLGVGGLIAAAERASVSRFIYLSYAGVDTGLQFPLERAKLANEQRVREARMTGVIVRPDAYQELHFSRTGRFDIKRGRVEIIGSGKTAHRWISVADVAALVAKLVGEADPPALVEVGGPEALSRHDAVAIVERRTGKAMRKRRLPRSAAKMMMRALSRVRPDIASVLGLGLVLDLDEPHWTDEPLSARGIEPRPVSRFIEDQIKVIEAAATKP